jgi:pimeloyl-ACP methyl ester carboxylesterase
MNEQAAWFGPHGGLFGVVSEPPAGTAVRDVGIILMNPGTLHRVGGARINVRLARRLAEFGFVSVRFDFSGLGDSEPRTDGLPYLESMVGELQAAMSLLESRPGPRSFVLMGHCTGAAMSFETAVIDTRVVGAVLMEGYAYQTRGYHVVRWRELLLSWSNWAGLLSGKKDLRPTLRRLMARLRPAAARAPEVTVRDAQTIEQARQHIRGLGDLLPSRSHVRTGLRELIQRRVRLLQIWGGGPHHYYKYRGQFADAFPDVDFQGLMEVEHRRDANHYFSSMAHQEWVDNRIVRWLTSVSCWLLAGSGYCPPDRGMM